MTGFDFAGTVEDIGLEATKCGIMLGDRVCTVVLGMNPNEPTIGALSFEEGVLLGISFMTTGLAIFKSLGVPAAIQLLKLAGFDPVATCSPHNFDLVRSYGATAVFDYKDLGVVPAIKAYTKNGLRFALDCISTTASMQFCYQVIGRTGGNYTALEPYAEAVAQKRKVVRPDWVMGPRMMGKEIGWPKPHWRPADADIGRFGAEWTVTLQKLLDKGLIRPHLILVRQGGLPEVLGGIEHVREKRISGQKLVFTV
ncbi:Polyketide synthase enoylreductase [Pyrenophora seminiperda CCB06]|uniref:Polyketide synthase enoylreductase n=1 Tax=Pyrenophora seminiperda CCB06 TaxID=1302712 RepID=A0A3M7M9C3_9PLEO|nr:Polyketide synthase enoylreductase [Pyrenophora seminiperda CCB06]